MQSAVCFVVALVLAFSSSAFAAPPIRFRFGTVRGVDCTALGTGRLYYTYFGIPFAEPPIGNLRFKPPVPYAGAASPDTVIGNDDYPRACMQQPPPKTGGMGEDCLYLTVFTPPDRANTLAEYKVMVWIHGGGFTQGLSRGYDPGRLVTEQNVIVVSVQYRLGLLGFLSSGDEALPGNLGLHDQLLALKWVKDNIRQFDGDPDDVTVFGESAGGTSVSHLALAPQAKGLFTKAIIMSGTSLAGWGLVKDPQTVYRRIARDLGCLPWFYIPGDRKGYHNTIKNCLERKSAKDLNYEPLGDKESFYTKGESGLVNFAPVVDGDIIPRSPKSLLQDDDYLRRNGVLDRSYAVGFTNQEGLGIADYIFAIPEATFEELLDPSNVAQLIKSVAEDDFSLSASPEVLNPVDFVYTYPREADGSIPIKCVVDLASDAGYVIPSVQFAQALAQKAPVYFYLFDHYPKLQDPEFPINGSTHGMDIFYLFDFPMEFSKFVSFYADVYTAESVPLPGIFHDILASFARSGSSLVNPSNLAPVTTGSGVWPRYDLLDQKYLAISTKPEVREKVFAQRVDLWTEFLPQLSAQYFFFGRRSRPAYD